LGDLFEGLPVEALAELQAVQRSALSAALLLSNVVNGARADRTIGVAVLGVLRTIVRFGPCCSPLTTSFGWKRVPAKCRRSPCEDSATNRYD
jgi:hypothetical protein